MRFIYLGYILYCVGTRFLSRKGLIGWVCLSVRLSVTPLLQDVQNHMSKGNKGRQPERDLEAEAKQALRTSLYIQSTLKRNLYWEFYNVLLNLCLEKQWIMY
jgi:hypothetical protein